MCEGRTAWLGSGTAGGLAALSQQSEAAQPGAASTGLQDCAVSADCGDVMLLAVSSEQAGDLSGQEPGLDVRPELEHCANFVHHLLQQTKTWELCSRSSFRPYIDNLPNWY